MNERGYSRRRFLLAAGTVGSAALLGIGVVAKRSFENTLAAELEELLSDLRGARKLGQAWIARHTVRARRADLLGELRRELDLGARAVEPDELRRRVTELVHGDYAAARVERIGGWVLSHTELRLCALAASTAAAPPPSWGRRRRGG